MVGNHRVQFVPLTRELAGRVGINLDCPHVAWVGVEDAPLSRGRRSVVIGGYRKRILGMGGLCWRAGLCWLWLDSVVMERTSAVKIVRAARDMLDRANALGDQRVFAARDEAPHSAKLLAMLGFVRMDDRPEFGGREIWQRSQQ